MHSIEKVKYAPKSREVTIEYCHSSGQHDIVLKSRQQPHPDFEDALNGLAKFVGEATGLNELVNMQVRGVTIKAFGEEGDGCCITALYTLEWSTAPLVINTPFTAIEAYPRCKGYDEDGNEIYHYLQDAVAYVVSEAQHFIQGKRAQADLFEKDNGMKERDDSFVEQEAYV